MINIQINNILLYIFYHSFYKKTLQNKKSWSVVIYSFLKLIISLVTFWYLGKPEDTRFGADGVAYLNLTVSCSSLPTTTNNAFQRKDNHYE